MADESDSGEVKHPTARPARRVRWRRNGPTNTAEVLALGPKAATAYAAQKERVRKRRSDSSADESADTGIGQSQAMGDDAPEMPKLATIHFDGGGKSPGPVTAACTVELSDGSFHKDLRRFDQGTHNRAEWNALILGLRLAHKHGARHVVVKGDSMLVVRQVNREWKTKHPALRSLRTDAEELLALFESWRVEWIPRKENWRVDELGRA